MMLRALVPLGQTLRFNTRMYRIIKMVFNGHWNLY
uniref:Uncharacterized protein n=1 Tax=Anguilla anguilla TaxID=7936 RepID=A0A0E9WCM9_ANGAN